MDAAEFEQRFGFAPEQDDLQRVTCPRAGETGHWSCGICERHNQPMFLCSCYVRAVDATAGHAADE